MRRPPARVAVDALVDAFVTDSGLSINFEVTGNLFRAPELGKFEMPHSNQDASNWFIDDS